MYKRMEKLTSSEIITRAQDVPLWTVDGDDTLTRTFAFADFVAAMRFVNAVADAAESANHHPDIDIRYSKVTLCLSTHNANGLTEHDFALAAVVNAFA